MRIIPLKTHKTFKPPFINDLEDLQQWLKPITVVCKGNIVCGGVMLSGHILATTAIMTSDNIVVQLPLGKTKAKRIDYSTDLFLSFYSFERPIPFIGLPTWTMDDDIDEDTKFFSYIPLEKERFVMFETIALEKSKSAQYSMRKDEARIFVEDVEHTFPVADQYGYFVGLGIGTSFGECLTLRFKNQQSKL